MLPLGQVLGGQEGRDERVVPCGFVGMQAVDNAAPEQPKSGAGPSSSHVSVYLDLPTYSVLNQTLPPLHNLPSQTRTRTTPA